MTRTELVKKVAMKMDELSSSDEMNLNIGIEDNNPLIILINGLLDEAVNETLAAIPQHRCSYIKRMLSSEPSSVSKFSLTKYDRSGTSSLAYMKITLPDEFLRFVRLTSAYHGRDILTLHNATDTIAIRQSNKHLRAGVTKPVAVLDNDVAGSPCVIVYSFPSDAVLTDSTKATAFYYVPRVDGLASDYIPELDNYITDIAAWVCAGKVFTTQGDAQRGAACVQNAQSLMV